MAKKETPASGDADQVDKSKPGDNGFDPETSENFVEKILGLHTEMDSESGRIRGEIKDVYAQARRAGVPKAVLKEVVDEIRTSAKKTDRLKEIDTEYPGQVEKLKAVLKHFANTPLGQAAIAKAEGTTPPAQPRDSWNPTGGDAGPQPS